MTPNQSATFSNLQELMQHVQESAAVDLPPAIESGDGHSETFPQLAEMTQALREAASGPPAEIKAELPHEEIMPEGGWLTGLSAPSAEDSESVIRLQFVEAPPENIAQRGASLLFGGTLLLILATLLACAVPASWVAFLKAKGPDADWLGNLAAAKTWVLGLGTLALVSVGMGSLRRRRWSVPLVHAGGWLVAIAVLMGLAVASGGFFFLVPHTGEASKPLLRDIGSGLIRVGIFGVVIPLVLIAIYQRRHLPYVTAQTDARRRWTDVLSEPLLMLWQCCLAVAVVVGSLAFLNGAFPLFGRMVGGSAGLGWIGGSVLLCLVAAMMLMRLQRTGWWLAAAVFCFLAATGITTFLQLPWSEVLTAWGKPTGLDSASQGPAKLAALFVGAGFAPLVMVLLMSRSAFPEPQPAEILPESHLPEAQS